MLKRISTLTKLNRLNQFNVRFNASNSKRVINIKIKLSGQDIKTNKLNKLVDLFSNKFDDNQSQLNYEVELTSDNSDKTDSSNNKSDYEPDNETDYKENYNSKYTPDYKKDHKSYNELDYKLKHKSKYKPDYKSDELIYGKKVIRKERRLKERVKDKFEHEAKLIRKPIDKFDNYEYDQKDEKKEKEIEIIRNEILSQRFNLNNIDTIKYYYSNILNEAPIYDPNYELTDNLTNQLLSSNFKFSFEHSIGLLKVIRKYFRLDNDNLQCKEISDLLSILIGKANEKIYDTFSREATNENLNFYFNNLFEQLDLIDNGIDSIYDEKLLEFLEPFILDNFDNFKSKFAILKLILNYSKVNVYNETLLKLIYDSYLTNKEFNSEVAINYVSDFYLLFTKFRLPFVDKDSLAYLLFDFKTKFQESKRLISNRKRMLGEIVINDHEKSRVLLEFLNHLVDAINNSRWNKFSSDDYKVCTLANVYSKLFNVQFGTENLTFNIKKNLERLSKSAEVKIGTDFLAIDNKIQENGQFNDIPIGSFGVFDKTLNELIPLNKFTSCFNKIEMIPLEENQQL